jgi:HEAT repeat protein
LEALLDKNACYGVRQALVLLGATAIPALTDALHSKDASRRREAAGVLGEMGATAAPAIPALRKALKDPNPDVRQAVDEALKAISQAPTMSRSR